MSDSDAIKESLEEFFSNFGAPNDAHAKIILQMVLAAALRPGNKNNRFWVKYDENVSVSGTARS